MLFEYDYERENTPRFRFIDYVGKKNMQVRSLFNFICDDVSYFDSQIKIRSNQKSFHASLHGCLCMDPVNSIIFF